MPTPRTDASSTWQVPLNPFLLLSANSPTIYSWPKLTEILTASRVSSILYVELVDRIDRFGCQWLKTCVSSVFVRLPHWKSFRWWFCHFAWKAPALMISKLPSVSQGRQWIRSWSVWSAIATICWAMFCINNNLSYIHVARCWSNAKHLAENTRGTF